MIVFKTFLKILNKNKLNVLLYTVILLVFGISNMQTSENSMNFSPSKPDVVIVNHDEEKGITKNLMEYIASQSNVVRIKYDGETINDALFYRDVNYVIDIPKHYREDFMNGKNPALEVKSTGDSQSAFEEMILSRYLKIANIYQKAIPDETELIRKVNEALSKTVETEMTSKLDTDISSKTAFYYNFASYSIMACLLFVVSLILNSFQKEKIRKRIAVSSTVYKKHNRILLLSCGCYALALWVFYAAISFVLVGSFMFSRYGVLYLLNSFVLTICATTIAFFIGNLVTDKGAINGIVNVFALGSSFLCGVFVPMQWLPDFVLKIAHVIPTYYYVSTNETLKTLETMNFETLRPVIINLGIMLGFSALFIALTNLVTKRKRRIK